KAEQTWPEITIRCHGLLRQLRSPLFIRYLPRQGISGVVQVLRAYHSHKWTEDFEEAFRRHFQLMIDSRGGTLRRKEEAMGSAWKSHAGHEPHTLVLFKFPKFLGNLAEPSDLPLEPGALSDFPRRQLASTRSRRIPFGEVRDVDHGLE